MSDLFWLTDAQMARLEPFSPKSHGKPRVDHKRVMNGITSFYRNDLRWLMRRENMVHTRRSTTVGSVGAIKTSLLR